MFVRVSSPLLCHSQSYGGRYRAPPHTTPPPLAASSLSLDCEEFLLIIYRRQNEYEPVERHGGGVHPPQFGAVHAERNYVSFFIWGLIIKYW